MGEFTIEVDDPRREDVRQLIEQHRMFASGVMPPESVHVLDPDDDALDADVTFFSVRAEGDLLGIGAIKQLDSKHAELRSMHTAADVRRRGVGRALIDHVLAVAAARGIRRLSLECGAGDAFAPARSLYAAAGFVPCRPFGGYEATRDNMFMTRALD